MSPLVEDKPADMAPNLVGRDCLLRVGLAYELNNRQNTGSPRISLCGKGEVHHR